MSRRNPERGISLRAAYELWWLSNCGGMEFGILGPLQVTDEGQPVPVAGAKVRALLALLLADVGEIVPAGRLADQLYGDNPPSNVANALQTRVSQLRRTLGAHLIVGRPPGYVLAVEPQAVDAVRFQRLVEQGRKSLADGSPEEASNVLSAALALWRGPAFVDVDLEATRAEASRLDELRLTALEDRIGADLALGRHDAVVAELQALVVEHPLREALRAQLMLALYRCGRQAEALRVYDEGRTQLVEELGLDPGPELRRLQAAILEHDPSLGAAPAQPCAVGRLPGALSGFVGRAAELAEVRSLVGRHRLVTVTGCGGAGKTRLALEVAGGLQGDFAGGVWLVELASLTDAAAVRSAVARALRVAPDALDSYFAGKQLLVVLDNCEHVLDGAAPLAVELLAAGGGVRVLATSREPLNVPGEVQWAMPPMSLDEAVELFAQRAAAVRPGTAAEVDSVAGICRRLDGLPLAIELAAARVKALPVREIAARLDDRFQLLTSGARTALPRHQTLRALVDWSYDLLFDDERVMFEELSVFADGVPLDAVDAVAASAGLDPSHGIDLVSHLVDKSLVTCEEQGGAARYRMLETLRQYGHDRLGERRELEAARRRHAAWALRLARDAAAATFGPELGAWVPRLNAELGNLREALRWAVEVDDAPTAVALASALAFPLWATGHQRVARQWLEGALATPGAARLEPAARARALGWAAHVTADHDPAQALAFGAAAVADADASGDPVDLAIARLRLAAVQVAAGETAEARAAVDRVEPVLGAAGDHWSLGWAANVRCLAALADADAAAAEAACVRSIEHFRSARSRWGLGRMAHKLAFVAELGGDYERAAALYSESIARAEELGLEETAAVLHDELGRVAGLAGDRHRADELQAAAKARLSRLGDFEMHGGVAARRSDLARARAMYADALRWYERAGRPDGVAFARDRLEFLAAALA